MSKTTSADRAGFEGAMRWVGDLDHPFYDDERQRHVWYEAAMIGFQLLIILQLAVCGIVMVVVGPGSFKYWAVGIGPVFVATVVASGYAASKGAPYTPAMSDLKRSRGVMGVVLGLIYTVGAFRMSSTFTTDGLEDGSSVIGFITGIVGGVLLMVGLLWLFKRSRTLPDDDELD